MVNRERSFLVIGDIHGNIDTLSRVILCNRDRPFDAVLLSGDIGLSLLTSYECEEPATRSMYFASVDAVFRMLSFLSSPILFVPGNWDLPNLTSSLSGVTNVDLSGSGRHCEIRGVHCVGMGGSKFINGNFTYEMSEDEQLSGVRLLAESRASVEDTIWIIHDPPFGTTLDVNLRGVHSGSNVVRAVLAEVGPRVCIAGHIHEAAGVEVLNARTLVINAGAIVTNTTGDTHRGRQQGRVGLNLIEQFFVLTLKNGSSALVEHWMIAGGNITRAMWVCDSGELTRVVD